MSGDPKEGNRALSVGKVNGDVIHRMDGILRPHCERSQHHM